MLVCQTFTMSDLVMLLHGQHQPLGRIQPQLAQFFRQNYLNGREPTDQNIAVCTNYPICPVIFNNFIEMPSINTFVILHVGILIGMISIHELLKRNIQFE